MLIQSISKPDFDVDVFEQLAIDEADTRDGIMGQMLTNPDIMVYYHCFYVTSKASEQSPGLFYPYWDKLVALLNHKNSYHRDIALTILANLTAVDDEDRFEGIFTDYFSHLNDPKFMTAQCCIRNSQKIARYKPSLRGRIIGLLLDIDNRCNYPKKQKALMKFDVLEILEEFWDKATPPEMAIFIKAQSDSLSPKTRKKAKDLVREFGLG